MESRVGGGTSRGGGAWRGPELQEPARRRRRRVEVGAGRSLWALVQNLDCLLSSAKATERTDVVEGHHSESQAQVIRT